jgi:MscS family membrane protein
MRVRRIVQIFIVVLSAISIGVLRGQIVSTSSNDPLGRSTPRGTVVGFLTAAHRGDWATAAQYLESTKGEDPAELATELSVVLDQGLPANLDQISDKPEGSNQPPNRELAGTIATNGGPLTVMLNRTHRGSQQIWLF